MSRQDQQALDERNGEDGDHHDGNLTKNLAHEARYEKQRGKGNDIGQHAERHRCGDLAGSRHGRLEPGFPGLAVVVHVLAGNDGIVHHDPQGDDKGEHGNDVDTDTGRRQKKQRPEDGNGNPQADPEGQTRFQEDCQQDEDQGEADITVAQHQVHPLPIDVGKIVAGNQLNTRWKVAVDLGHLFPDFGGHLQRRLVAHTVDVDENGPLAIVGGEAVGLLETVDHFGDVRQQHLGAVIGGDNGNAAEFGAEVAPFRHAYQHVAALGLD